MNFKIRTNKIMDEYLSKIGYNFWDTSIFLPAGLSKKIQSEFVKDNDCVVLKEDEITSNPKFDTNIKKCEWEWFETHFHPDSYIETDDEIEYLKLALECSKQLAKRLDAEFKDKNFRLSVSFSETVKTENKIEFYGSSTVRFYQIRQECEDIMRTEDLNAFKLEAVLDIEITQ